MIKELNDIKVLMIDDSNFFSKAFTKHLDDNCAKVLCVNDPTLAIEKACEFRPDIIITDNEMPKITGLELITQFRKDPQWNEIPIIFLTGSQDPEAPIKAIQRGADDFISKDIFAKVLIPKMLALVRIRNRNLELMQLRQNQTMVSLIGTYKHEFGNSITILEGYWHLLKKNSASQEIYDKGNNAFHRIKDLLRNLDKLKVYEEEEYIGGTKIVKIK